MAINEALKSARYAVDSNGKAAAVLLDIENWETIIDWIENISDTKVAIQALDELRAAGGRPQQAGWLDWKTIREQR